MSKNDFKDINFFVGVNGSGKSRYLNSVAKLYNNFNDNVLAISNTVFDKINPKYCNKTSANRGRYFLKKNLFEALFNDRKSIDIFNILEYLEYDKSIEVSFNFGRNINKKNLYDYLIEKIIHHNKEDYNKISIKIEEIEEITHLIIDNCFYDKKFGFSFSFDDYDVRSKSNWDYILHKIYSFFKKTNIVKINIVLKKHNESFLLDGASSGESHFLSNMIFLQNNLNYNKKNIVLIDEPEISLHPKWQRDYVFKLYDYFYKYNIQFFLATHSPLIISKVQTSKKDIYQDYINNINYEIFKVKNQKIEAIKEDSDYSIESLYWEIFGILTPDNAFLARYCVDLLDEYNLKAISHQEILHEFRILKDACDLELQKQVLVSIENRFILNEH